MTGQSQEELKPEHKKSTVSQGVLYGVGCGIGGSIFVLLSTGIRVAGPGVMISLLLGGILIFLTALNYSELSTSLPLSGGDYNFGKEGVGGFFAFIIGFFLWIANIATCSFSAQVFALTIEIFFPFLSRIPVLPIAIFTVLFISIVFFRTQRFAMRTLLILTVTLISIFLVFIISGLFISPITNPSGYDPSYIYSGTSIFGVFQMFALLFIFFTSITSNLAYFNSDLKNPSKNIPKVNILAILLTLVIYLSITFVVLINLGNRAEELGDSPVLLGEVLFDILGPFGFYLMGIALLISTLIAMNAAIGSAVNVLQALARDNYAPKKLAKLKENSDLPVNALIVTTVIAMLFTYLVISFADIGITAEITIFIYFFGLAFVNFASVNLRYKRKELARPFKAPFFPYLPIIVGSTCLFLAFILEPTAIILGIIFFAIAMSYYLLTIADRYSIVITLAGIKLLAIILIGTFIWVINNMSTLKTPIHGFDIFFTTILLRILIIICIFTLGTVFLDIIPLREVVYFFVKRIYKEKVAINVGVGQIIELDESRTKMIHSANFVIAVFQLVSSGFMFYLIYLFGLNIISIEQITIGNIIIGNNMADYFFNVCLFFLAVCLLISGMLLIYLNQKLI